MKPQVTEPHAAPQQLSIRVALTSSECDRINLAIDRVHWSGTATIPWLVFPTQTDGLRYGFIPGDVLYGLSAEAGWPEQRMHDLIFEANNTYTGALLAGLTWRSGSIGRIERYLKAIQSCFEWASAREC